MNNFDSTISDLFPEHHVAYVNVLLLPVMAFPFGYVNARLVVSEELKIGFLFTKDFIVDLFYPQSVFNRVRHRDYLRLGRMGRYHELAF